MEIEGFFPNSVLRVAGYKIEAKFLPGLVKNDKKDNEVLKGIENSLVQFLKQTFSSCEVTVSPATVMA